jgi:hypothetical protein
VTPPPRPARAHSRQPILRHHVRAAVERARSDSRVAPRRSGGSAWSTATGKGASAPTPNGRAAFGSGGDGGPNRQPPDFHHSRARRTAAASSDAMRPITLRTGRWPAPRAWNARYRPQPFRQYTVAASRPPACASSRRVRLACSWGVKGGPFAPSGREFGLTATSFRPSTPTPRLIRS